MTVTKRLSPSILLLLVVIPVAVIHSACLPTTPGGAASPLTVLGTLDITPANVVEAHIVLKRGKHVVEATVPVRLNEFQGSLQVPVGSWELTVHLVDAEGLVHFQSKPQTIQVAYGIGSTVELTLQPAASTVHIAIDLENYVFREEALRARIHFDDQVYEVIRHSGDAPFEASLEISPGSYEFKIELYTESFRASDRLGAGAWQVLHIPERQEVFLTWSPETSEVLISGRVEQPLPAPSWVVVRDLGPAVEITWEEVDHWGVAGYLVLAQTTPMDRFSNLTSPYVNTPKFLHVLESEDRPRTLRYVVAPVSTSGLVGYYSDPQPITP